MSPPTRVDAVNAAKRARTQHDQAAEMQRMRAEALESAIKFGYSTEEIEFARRFLQLTEQAVAFYAQQAVAYAELASEP